MIKNIIFDLAGVVLNLNLDRDTIALKSIGLPSFEECIKMPELIKLLDAYLSGLMPEKEFLPEIKKHCSEGVTDEQVLYAMNAVLDDIPKERLEFIIGLRKRYKVFLLSNIYDHAWDHALSEFRRCGHTTEECFDRIFLSHELQLAKPDPRIFQYVIDETRIKPEETIFFDDSRSNIKTALSMGFDARLVKNNLIEEYFTML